MIRSCVGFTLLCFLQTESVASTAGLIVDSRGAPASGAYVRISGISAKNVNLFVNAKADEQGHFVLPTLPEGDYRLEPWDDARGVPDTVIAVLQPLKVHPVFVHVTQLGLKGDLRLQLPPAYGLLRVTVSDLQTHQELEDATVTLTRSEDENVYLITHLHQKTEFVRLVPMRPLSVVVSVAGYVPWKSEAARPIVVSPGQTLRLNAGMARQTCK